MMRDKFTISDWHVTHRLLDDAVRKMCLLGSANTEHLIAISAKCLDKSSSDDKLSSLLHLRVALDCLVCALEEDILDPDLVLGLLQFDKHIRLLSAGLRDLLHKVAGFIAHPPDLSALLDRLRAADTFNTTLSPHQIVTQAVRCNDLSIVTDLARLLERQPGLGPVAEKLRADALFLQGDYEQADRLYAGLCADFFELAGERRAQTLVLLGDKEQAVQTLGRVVAAGPWRTNMVLKLHDLMRGRDAGRSAMEPTSVLLYTHNHCADLDQTLDTLARSTAAAMDIFVLVNGCTDQTGQVLAAWRDSKAFPRLKTIVLPINIGAPAARNWLLGTSRVMRNNYIAFLDDDISLAPDWLEALFFARDAYPKAGVWGVKVCERARPQALQQVDLNLFYPPVNNELVGFSDLHADMADRGQFDYMRPSASVTGCCHLFRRSVFERVGPFDIRFSPSQYDDFDHSLRLIQADIRSVYTGHVAVGHARVSGHGASMSRAALYNVFGNIKKLAGKHDPEAIQRYVAAMDAVLLDDYLTKLAVIRSEFPTARTTP